MFQMYFLVKDENELKDKVWKIFFKKLAGGAALRVQELELEVDGNNKRLFKVWTEWPAAPCIIMPAAAPIEVKPLWQQEGVIQITC